MRYYSGGGTDRTAADGRTGGAVSRRPDWLERFRPVPAADRGAAQRGLLPAGCGDSPRGHGSGRRQEGAATQRPKLAQTRRQRSGVEEVPFIAEHPTQG